MEDFLTTKDFLVSGEEFKLLRDSRIDLLATNPQPADLTPYYESDAYISHTDSDKGIIGQLYQWVKKITLRRKVKLFNKYSGSDRTVLDIGAGTGDLLLEAKKNGFAVYGVEPNELAREKAREKGIDLKAEYPSGKKFGIISLWHVLEHLPDPNDEFKKIRAMLSDSGTIFIAVPNFNSYDAKYYKEFWAGYDVPRHLWHFSRKAIFDLCSNHQMEVVETKPMIFDSFYVSMLSEKYRKGRSNLIWAFLIGLLSNLKARANGEYSSLLYVIQKARNDV